jgi:hypothetical protein
MPVAVLQEMQGVTADRYDAVNEKMDVANDPPEGLIFHTGGPMEGGWRIFDVWESADAYERFSEERLGPAVREVLGGEMTGPPPRQEVYELHGFIRP